MATKEKTAEALLKEIDKKVAARGKAILAELDATAEITQLVSEARRKGVTMSELSQHVQRMDKRERKLKPVTRQALDTMIAVHEQRRPARTTRTSRRARNSEPAGKINMDALK
jgi:urease gamma subunit